MNSLASAGPSSSSLGVAARIKEAYPDLPVHGFAAMRAISDPADFRNILDPRRGRITLRGDQTHRHP